MNVDALDASGYVISEHVAARAVSEEETVVLDLRSERYYGLNSTGSRIWSRIEAGDSLDALADDIAAETGTDRDEVVADAVELLDGLVSVGLLRRVGSDAG